MTVKAGGLVVLGVDPAARTGWALVGHGGGRPTLLEVGALTGKRHEAAPSDVVRLAVTRGATIMAIEEPPLVRENPHTYKRIVEHRVRWEVRAQDAGLEVVRVHTSTWHAAMLGRANYPRAQCKALAVSLAKARFRVTLSEDEADAALVATYVVEERAYKRAL